MALVHDSFDDRKSQILEEPSPSELNPEIKQKKCCNLNKLFFTVTILCLLFNITTVILAIVTLITDQEYSSSDVPVWITLVCGIVSVILTIPGFAGATYDKPAAFCGFAVSETVFQLIQIITVAVVLFYNHKIHEVEQKGSLFWFGVVTLCLGGASMVCLLAAGIALCFAKRGRQKSYITQTWCTGIAGQFQAISFVLVLTLAVILIAISLNQYIPNFISNNSTNSLNETLYEQETLMIQSSLITQIAAAGLSIVAAIAGSGSTARHDGVGILASLIIGTISVFAQAIAAGLIIHAVTDIKKINDGQDGMTDDITNELFIYALICIGLASIQFVLGIFQCIVYSTDAEELYLADYL